MARRELPGTIAMLEGAVVAVVVLSGTWRSSSAVWWAILAAGLITGGLVWLSVTRHGWLGTLFSPIGVVALVELALFVVRPASLTDDPTQASPGLVNLGFSWSDLAHATATGALGFGLFGVAFLIGWRHTVPVERPPLPLPTDRRLAIGGLGALAVGCALWGALFLKNGGPSALANDPSRLHLGQFGGGYGAVGFALCLGVFLLMLHAWLQWRTRLLLAAMLLGVVASIAAAVALQTRGELIATLIAAAVLVFGRQRLSWRAWVAVGLIAVVALYGLTIVRTVRSYSQTQPVGVALKYSVRTNPLTLFGRDFTETDHFVALERLVPGVLDRLHGSSFAQVPATFVPRQLWSGKPKPIDYKLGRQLYGPDNRSGTPFTLAGEALWNYGVVGSLICMALLGLLAGLGWNWLTSRRKSLTAVFAALLVGYSYLLLTRPLGPMVQTATIGLVALAVVAVATGVVPFRGLRRAVLAEVPEAGPGETRRQRLARRLLPPSTGLEDGDPADKEVRSVPTRQ